MVVSEEFDLTIDTIDAHQCVYDTTGVHERTALPVEALVRIVDYLGLLRGVVVNDYVTQVRVAAHDSDLSIAERADR